MKSSIGQLNGIAVGIFAIAQAKHIPLSDFPDACTARHQRFAHAGNIGCVKNNLWSLAAW